MNVTAATHLQGNGSDLARDPLAGTTREGTPEAYPGTVEVDRIRGRVRHRGRGHGDTVEAQEAEGIVVRGVLRNMRRQVSIQIRKSSFGLLR